MTMTFFFISKVLPFRDLQISLSFKGRISFPETFADLFVAILFLFRCCICIFFFPVSACVLTQTCILPVTHAANHTTTHPSILSHMRHAGLLAPPTRGRGWCPIGASRWRRWTWLLSTESSHSYTMGPFTHMSDSVADWGRGTLRVAPSRVGGPQNCDGSWFISVHN